MLRKQVFEHMKMKLDLRSFLKIYIDLRLLVKRTMTVQQRKLFAYQRDRLLMLEDEDSFDSELDVDEDTRRPEAVKAFMNNVIDKYVI